MAMIDVTGKGEDAVETSAMASKLGRVAVIEAEADIRRSPETVFDYASDPPHEPEWNIRMRRPEKLTGGPVGDGARYRRMQRELARDIATIKARLEDLERTPRVRSEQEGA